MVRIGKITRPTIFRGRPVIRRTPKPPTLPKPNAFNITAQFLAPSQLSPPAPPIISLITDNLFNLNKILLNDGLKKEEKIIKLLDTPDKKEFNPFLPSSLPDPVFVADPLEELRSNGTLPTVMSLPTTELSANLILAIVQQQMEDKPFILPTPPPAPAQAKGKTRSLEVKSVSSLSPAIRDRFLNTIGFSISNKFGFMPKDIMWDNKALQAILASPKFLDEVEDDFEAGMRVLPKSVIAVPDQKTGLFFFLARQDNKTIARKMLAEN
ncbi:MAG: hypothetical protein HQ564_06065 [Candidatus Saganbacteria bacterium]|nr:hypothetical protein [Candidatus Saganbacteria bacterium]